MSDFDPNDIIDNDFDEADIISDEKKVEVSDISKAKSALKGAEQGLTFGTADEAAGILGTIADKGQALLNKATFGLVPISGSFFFLFQLS